MGLYKEIETAYIKTQNNGTVQRHAVLFDTKRNGLVSFDGKKPYMPIGGELATNQIVKTGLTSEPKIVKISDLAESMKIII